MGSSSRMDRCERFIKEFNDDFIAKNGIGDGDEVVVSEGLGFNDLYECVFHYVTIRTGNSVEFELMFPDPIFDPETEGDDVIANVAFKLNKTQKNIRNRFRKANLLTSP